MKALPLALMLLAMGAACAQAQTRKAPPTAEEIAATRTTDALILRGKDVPVLKVAQWERDGAMFHAWPGDGKVPPYDASRVEAQLYNFPTGQLRLLKFPKGTRTHWHTNEDDMVLHGISGKQVEFVEEEVFYSQPGDTTFHPAGVRHHSESITEVVRGEFAFHKQPGGGKAGVFHHATNLPLQDVADLMQGRAHTIIAGEAAKGAPAATRYQIRTFLFPNYRLDEARYPQGYRLGRHTVAQDKLVYVKSGRLKVTTGDVTDEVGPGDMYRMVVGKPFAREALEDTVTIEVDGSKVPPRR